MVTVGALNSVARLILGGGFGNPTFPPIPPTLENPVFFRNVPLGLLSSEEAI